MRPGCNRPLALRVFGSIGKHADFAGHDHAVVVRQVIAAGTQTVAIEHRADVLAVGERRSTPGRPTAPSRTSDIRKTPACPPASFRASATLRESSSSPTSCNVRPRHQQEFQHVVEIARVGAVRLARSETASFRSSPNSSLRSDPLRGPASSSCFRAAC